METVEKPKRKGLSLRTTSALMLIVSLLITIGLVVTGIRTFNSFREMKKSTDDYIELSEAANELMDTSDYLTEEVQLYTVLGDRTHMDNYITEANVTRRRERAISVMKTRLPDSEALRDLLEAMRESTSLMEREYYAMKLMTIASGETDVPPAVEKVTLSARDKILTPQEKTDLALRMVHDDTYYEQKNKIRQNMSECVAALKNSTYKLQKDMENSTNRNLVWMAVLILLQTLAFFLMLWVTTRLGINPVLRAVDNIRKNQKLPIVGASEYRYLANTYNVMYSAYKDSIEQLNFSASHDELTGLYNRAGYDLILSAVNLKTTTMLLFDTDYFKSINEQFGYETASNVLKKVADALTKNFRSDDYICHIESDMFVVFMVHMAQESRELIERKVNRINRELFDDSDGLPKVTLSAGIAFGKDGDAAETYRRAEIALEYVKRHGKNGCCFYSEDLEMK